MKFRIIITLLILIIGCSSKMSIEELEIEIKKYYIEWNKNWARSVKVLSVKLVHISGNDYSGKFTITDGLGEMTYEFTVVYDGETLSEPKDVLNSGKQGKVYFGTVKRKVREAILKTHPQELFRILDFYLKDLGESEYHGIIKTLEENGNFIREVHVILDGSTFAFKVGDPMVE